MTVRLYLEDSFLRTFDAQVEASRPASVGWEIALDRTAFYPTGGGQPADAGTLAGLSVLDVHEDGARVWHVLPQEVRESVVHGVIDWERRFDHMQQHTGQHILSAVALDCLGAQTVSFHLGTEVVTIDLDRVPISPDEIAALEEGACRIIAEDLPVRSYFAEPEEVARLPLRKPPSKGERTRIVEIPGVDLSPCGGTHTRSTGQVSLIKIRRVERYKGGSRVEFLCGWRALRDYQWKHLAISALARDLSVADRDVEAAVRRSLAAEKEAQRQAEALRGQLLAHEAAILRQAATRIGPSAVIAQAFAGRPAGEVKQLANLLASEPGTVALLAAHSPAVRLFFLRSADATPDMRELLRQVTQRFGGGGGGRPEAAEGGGLPPERVAEALAWAVQQLQQAPE